MPLQVLRNMAQPTLLQSVRITHGASLLMSSAFGSAPFGKFQLWPAVFIALSPVHQMMLLAGSVDAMDLKESLHDKENEHLQKVFSLCATSSEAQSTQQQPKSRLVMLPHLLK
jgi:hypothetical protein